MVRSALAISLFLGFVYSAYGQGKTLPADERIQRFLNSETARLNKRFLDGARSLKAWQTERPRLHREYLDMLGLWPLPEKTDLKATVTGKLEHEGVVIENLHFQSRPGLYVTANFYRPAKSMGKLPTILYVCGHNSRGRDGVKTAFQDHGMWFASNGYNCLIVDTLQLGEIPGVHHGTYGRPWTHIKSWGVKDPEREKEGPRWWWHSMGYTPAGVEAWNGIRAIDYLLTRPEVDGEKIGVTGISGGGAATFWIACADDRVKVAVPVSGMSDLESYVKNKVINGHCDCMFLTNTYQWDWTTIAALFAPRPMLFANSDNDPIFPMDGNRRIIEKLHMIYALHGKQDLVEEYVSKGGHDYRPDLRIAIFKFINKHLKADEKAEVKDVNFTPIPAKALRVFPTDEGLPKDSINHKIDEVFSSQVRSTPKNAAEFEAWRTNTLAELKKRSLRNLEHGDADEEGADDAFLFKDSGSGPILYMEREDLEAFNGRAFAKKYKEKLPVVGYIPRALSLGGPLEADETFRWTRKSPPNYVERSHALLGYTVDERKLHHLLRTVRKLTKTEQNWDGRVIAKGPAGIIAAYAMLFEPAIKELVLIDPPTTHRDGPHFLNVLRITDIPETLGMLVPRKVRIVSGGEHNAFDRTAELYRIAGAEKQCVRN